jgi:hypothetical protein
VNIKKREENKEGEEFIFVDPKTGASGELSRKKYLDMEFITPTLEEREKNDMTCEKYILDIRNNVFGVKSAKGGRQSLLSTSVHWCWRRLNKNETLRLIG